ncbi:hypothetical protein D3C81_1485550 [compost metagenome]
MDAGPLEQHRQHQGEGQHGRERHFHAIPVGCGSGRAGLARGGHGGRIAGLVDGGDQGARFQAARHLDARAFRRQVDAGGQHARHLQQGFFHPAHARGARHAGDVQVDLALRHAIAGLFHGCLQGGQGNRRVGTDFGHFGGQVDAGLSDAGHGGQGLFHAAHARGAAHAFDGQRLRMRGGGWGSGGSECTLVHGRSCTKD